MVNTHPRYCVGLPIVGHGHQAIRPRYCVRFILALAGAQVSCRFEVVLVWVRGSKAWMWVACSGILEARTCRWHSRYAVWTAERKRRHVHYRRTNSVQVNVLMIASPLYQNTSNTTILLSNRTGPGCRSLRLLPQTSCQLTTQAQGDVLMCSNFPESALGAHSHATCLGHVWMEGKRGGTQIAKAAYGTNGLKMIMFT